MPTSTRNRRTALMALALAFVTVTGLVACEHDAPAAPTDKRAKAVTVAKAQVGDPYRSGASGPDAFDCSGLTSYAWSAAGVSLPRTARAQYAATGRITKAQLLPGDLIFYSGTRSASNVTHVAMYIGNGQMVQAQKAGVPANIQGVDWWSSNRVGFGRIPNV